MKNRQSHSFSMIPKANIPRSVFDRSHGHKTTFDAGTLVPIYVDEVLPGDTITLNASVFARLATPIVPAMDNLWMDLFFFAVPARLVWTNWQRFMGEQDSPGDSTDYIVPTLTAPVGGFTSGSLFDYMGIPTGIANLKINALPIRAYYLIYNEWFRDQNLCTPVAVPKDDGPDDELINVGLVRRAKRHDYFTSCLPWPQKGEGVDLPLGDTAPVIPDTADPIPFWTVDSQVTGGAGMGHSPGSQQVLWGAGSEPGGTIQWGGQTGLVTDMTGLTNINSLRQAFQLQKLLERDARGGTRYTEILRSHFGVISPDARLQRPEYLGGGTLPVNIHPVPQTSGSPPADQGYTDTPQGNLAAFGTAAGNAPGFTKSFVEHCYIIGIVNVRSDLTYQQGLNKLWSRSSKYDFYWPALAHIGEQAVLNKEIYAQGTAQDDEVFGYQERWAEYRYAPSKVTGQFRSTYAESLDVWHYAQDYDTLPTLSQAWIEEEPFIDRTIAVQTYPHFLADVFFRVKAARPMPTYSVPGYIDHF